MKRKTALKYAREIARRVHEINGLLATPLCQYEAMRISRMWVFGSTVKGKQNPNDLDLLIEMTECGRSRSAAQTTADKRNLRRGFRFAPSSRSYALKWLTRGMKLVSRHDSVADGGKVGLQVLIYPRYDIPDE